MKRSSDAISELPVVLICGASFGGLSTAVRLIENEGTKQFRVILLDANDFFTIGGLWQFVWNNRLKLDQITFDLKEAKLPGIELRLNTIVKSWEPSEKKVVLDDGSSLSYDHLVMACGAVTDPSAIPGLKDHVNVGSFGTLDRQQKEVNEFMKKAAQVGADEEKVTFVLAIGRCPYKCPVAPFELTFLLEEQLRKANLRDRCRFVITCPKDWPMPEGTRPEFDKVLEERNVEFLGKYELEKVEDSTLHFKNGKKIAADLIWSTHRIQAPSFVQKALPNKLLNGFVLVDDAITYKVDSYPNTHVIGDCSVVEFGDWEIPKAGEFAWKAGHSAADSIVDAENIFSDRTGRCIAELGFGKGITVTNDFSEICQTRGPHKVKAESLEKAEEEKIIWANSYLTTIFGESKKLSVDLLRD